MTDALAQLLDLTNAGLIGLFAVFLRVGGIMIGAPVFGEQSIPARVRLAIALGFTLLTAPMLSDPLAPIVARGTLIGPHVIGEFLAGLAIGLVLRVAVLALQVVGTIAAQATSLSALFGGTAGEPQPAISHLLTLGALAFAAMMGLHIKIVQLIVLTYEFLPVGGIPDAEDIRAWSVESVQRSFSLAFTLSAPFLLTSLVYNVALGAINRAMPQLMVSTIGAPALTAAGLLMVAICVPTGIVLWHEHLSAFLLNPAGGLR